MRYDVRIVSVNGIVGVRNTAVKNGVNTKMTKSLVGGRGTAVVLSLVAVLAAGCSGADAPAPADFDDALRIASETGTLALIDFYTDW
jgi:hypothetical protein